MLEWLLYNTVIPLMPVFAILGISKLTKNNKKRFFQIIKDGQLCLYCILIGTLFIRDLLTVSSLNTLVLGGVICVLFVTSGVYFVAVIFNEEIEEGTMGWVSIGAAIFVTLFVLTLRATENLL